MASEEGRKAKEKADLEAKKVQEEKDKKAK